MRPSWGSDGVDPTDATKASAARGSAPYSAALAPAWEWTALQSQDGPQRVANVGSRNFTLSVPVAHYPGRGKLPLALDLVYNSRVWQRIGITAPKMAFDLDNDWPAPGWSLGFGKLVRLKGGIAMLVEPDGTRHPFYVDGQRNDRALLLTSAHTTDGTGISYTIRTTTDPEHRLHDGRVSRADGTTVDFQALSWDRRAVHATRVTDANGNAVTIKYRDSGAPSIDTITDTCGRVIRFHYDEVNLGVQPLFVTGPGPGPTGADVELIRLQYESLRVSHTFLDPVLEDPRDVSVVTGIYSATTRTGYSQHRGTYSSYGMLRHVRACRGMSIAGPNQPDAGRIRPGQVSWQREYDYPEPGTPLADVPAYTTMTETWDGQTGGPAVTRFQVGTFGDVTRTQITWPDDSRTVYETGAKAGTKPAGLLNKMTIFDADGREVQSGVNEWNMKPDGTPQLFWTKTFNGRDEFTKTEFAYWWATLPVVVDQYEWGDTKRVRRRTSTQFVDDQKYLGRNLRNLPQVVRVYEPFINEPGVVLTEAAHTEYLYDESERRPTPGTVGYDERFVPGNPAYQPETTWRGNPTTIRRYSNAAQHARPVTETRTYDACGNMLTSDLGVGRTKYEYEVGHQYMAPSLIKLTGRGSGFYASHTVANTRYGPNGQPLWHYDNEDRRTDFQYDPAGRPTLLTFSSGATVLVVHDDVDMTQSLTVRDGENPSNVAAFEVRAFDGNGNLSRVRRFTPDGWDIEDYQYDRRGRLNATTGPCREGTAPNWSRIDYDSLSRPVRGIDADGGVTRWYYDERAHPQNATPATVPGSCVRTTDPRGRERWQRLGPLGEVQELVEPAPDGSGAVFPTGGLLTTYRYDANGNVSAIDLSVNGAVAQQRRFRHDSLGRLVRALLPEAGAGVVEDHAGRTERWNRGWSYDDRSNIIESSDNRGVITSYQYDGDVLDRIQRVKYLTKYFDDVDNPIVECPDVEYTYVNHGDPRKVMFENTVGVSFRIFRYDAFGRLISTDSLLPSAEGFPFTVDYPRDTLGRRTGIVYPSLYGDPSPGRRPTIDYKYGLGGHPSLLTVDGIEQASAFAYASGGRIAEMKVGPPGSEQVVENYAYEAPHPGLTGQRLTRNGSALLDLTYHYWPASRGTGPVGQLRSITDNLGSVPGGRSFLYDALGRLKTAAGGTEPTWTWVEDYRYDMLGNRTTVVADGEIQPGRAAPPDGQNGLAFDEGTNHISSAGFAYDAAGNLVASRTPDGTEFRYQYDAAGRLVFVQNTTTEAITAYVYGACNRRRASLRLVPDTWPPSDTSLSIMADPKNRIEAATFYVWDGDAIIAEYEDDGPSVGKALVWKDVMVYLGDRVLSHTENHGASGGRTLYEHPGPTGTRFVTGTNLARNHESLPFGSSTVTDGGAAHPFTTYERDTRTGLDYAVNRFYHAALGRFLQPDPLGAASLDVSSSQSLNLYAYCNNDPINRTDPLGLVWNRTLVFDGASVEDAATFTYHVEWVWSDRPDPSDSPRDDSGSARDDSGRVPGRGGSERNGTNPRDKKPSPWWEQYGFRDEQSAREYFNRLRDYDRPLESGFNPIDVIVKGWFNIVSQLALPYIGEFGRAVWDKIPKAPLDTPQGNPGYPEP